MNNRFYTETDCLLDTFGVGRTNDEDVNEFPREGRGHSDEKGICTKRLGIPVAGSGRDGSLQFWMLRSMNTPIQKTYEDVVLSMQQSFESFEPKLDPETRPDLINGLTALPDGDESSFSPNALGHSKTPGISRRSPQSNELLANASQVHLAKRQLPLGIPTRKGDSNRGGATLMFSRDDARASLPKALNAKSAMVSGSDDAAVLQIVHP